MEFKNLKNQRGYLLIVAIIAIVIVGFVAGIFVNMYITSTKSTTNVLQADQALYIAKSGLEKATRDLTKPNTNVSCQNINYLNFNFPPNGPNYTGKFTVTSETVNLTTQLAGINDVSETITLTSNPGLASQGVIQIDNEIIWYPEISGLQLLKVKRGVMGTAQSQHQIGRPVKQNICALTSSAGVPDFNNPGGKRIIKGILLKGSGGVGSLPEDITPALVSAGSVSLTGSSDIHNNSVTIGGSKFSKSTIVSGGPVVLNNAARTRVGPNDSVASRPNNFLSDISQNNGTINLGTIWGYFFDQTKNELKNSPSTTIVTNCNSFNFAAATGTLWLTCNFNPSGNITIGSTTNPVTIITENNVNMSGNFTLNGMLYVMGALSTQGSSRVNGIVVVEGAVNSNSSDGIYYDPAVLTALNLLKGYNKYYISWEYFN